MSNVKTKKVLSILSKVLTWIVLGITVLMVIFTVFSTRTFDRNDRSLFGTRFYIVLSDSMSLSEKNKDDEVHFNAGDIVLIKNVDDPAALTDGEIIAFVSQNQESFGETVTHRIRSRWEDGDGDFVGYITYGTNTGVDDDEIVRPEYVLGRYSGKLPKLGNFFAFLKTTPGYITCILVPFLILMTLQGVSTVRLFIKYKKEQAAVIEAEKAAIEEERRQNKEMLEELMALKAQLEQQKSPPQPAEENGGSGDGADPEN